MPQISVMYWNIETFGLPLNYRDARLPYCAFIADVAGLYGADVLFIQELRLPALFGTYMQQLQFLLNQLPAPHNNWHYDFIKGSVSATGTAPYATSMDLAWDAGHYEGYVVFWNQNLAKFHMTPAPPVQPPGGGAAVANSQSETVRMQAQITVLGNPQALPGVAVPGGGIAVPGVALPYVVPGGTVVPGNPPLAGPTPAASGNVVPVGTVVGPGGIVLNSVVNGVNPVVVPGGFMLTDPLTLPAAGTVLVPEHAASLVLFGRDTGTPPATAIGDISGATANFNPAAANIWNWLLFPRGAGFPAVGPGARRPMYVTLDTNRQAPHNGAADRLVPALVYHAPAAASAAAAGMQRAAYSQPMYQAYDSAAGNWINCNNAVLGGDFNVPIDSVDYPYDAFTDPFAAGGANCAIAVASPALPPSPPNTRAGNPANKSLVHISTFPAHVPIFSGNLDDYRARAIDNIFYRGLVAAGGAPPLYNMLAGVTGGPNPVAPMVIASFMTTPAIAAVANAQAAGMPLPPTPNIQNAALTVQDIQGGLFGTVPAAGNATIARRAGEFVRLFISDHQPIALLVNL